MGCSQEGRSQKGVESGGEESKGEQSDGGGVQRGGVRRGGVRRGGVRRGGARRGWSQEGRSQEGRSPKGVESGGEEPEGVESSLPAGGGQARDPPRAGHPEPEPGPLLCPQVKSFIETQKALLAEIQNGCKRNLVLVREREEKQQRLQLSAAARGNP